MKPTPKIIKFFNLIFRGGVNKNADGTVTTKFGHRIIPLKETKSTGMIRSNIAAYLNQPRAHAISKMLTPLYNAANKREAAVVIHKTGEIFLASDTQRAKPLGKIDPKVERDLFDKIESDIRMTKIIRAAERN